MDKVHRHTHTEQTHTHRHLTKRERERRISYSCKISCVRHTLMHVGCRVLNKISFSTNKICTNVHILFL